MRNLWVAYQAVFEKVGLGKSGTLTGSGVRSSLQIIGSGECPATKK
jgi:hypothetical protein